MNTQSNNSTQREDRVRLLAYWASFLVSALLMGLKFWAYEVTRSQAIFSDALESIVNVITPVVGLLALRAASKPADKEHPYGHGKLEYFSSAFEGGLILFASVMILSQAVIAALEGQQLFQIETGLAMIVGAALVNLALGYGILKVGEKYHSVALQANGRHILSDVWTTAGVIVGLFAVKLTGVTWLDLAAAVVVGLLLGFEGLRVVLDSAGGLMDAEDQRLTQVVADLFTEYRPQGVIHIHHTRVMRSGRYHHIDAHVVLPEYWDVNRAHAEMQDYENQVIRSYPVDGEVHFHLDPCRRVYCRFCDEQDCPVRQDDFQKLLPFTVESLTQREEPEEFRKNH